MDDNLARLEKEYCPPIDSSLFFAIVLDHDPSNSQSLEELCTTLDELKASALAEETRSFDPSGSSSLQQDENASEDSSHLVQSWDGEVTSNSNATADTDLTDTSQVLEKEHRENFLHDKATEALTGQQKAAALKEMFPETKIFDVEWILRKVRYNFSKAVDELLNQEFLMGGGLEGGVPLLTRGIDGFTESGLEGQRKKKKSKKGQKLSQSSADKSIDAASPSSRWDRVKDDIDFLEQRTFISRETIASTYHRSGASLPSTIAAISSSEKSDTNPHITPEASGVLEMHSIDLALDFPSLPYAQISALIHLSYPSTTSARELAHALVSSHSTTFDSKIIPQYLSRPPTPDEIPKSYPSPESSYLDPSRAAALVKSRSTAFDQAQSAFRKSKSKPHFGGAAAYYSEVGRDASASLRKHDAAAADQLVAGQSKLGEIDLHGVNAHDAVRISRARVGSWWDLEAQEWWRTGKPRGDFRIVTGRGHHSTGGKGVLGPVVFKALLTDGWKVRMEQGYIVISGQAKK